MKHRSVIPMLFMLALVLAVTGCDQQTAGWDEASFQSAVDTAVAATDEAQLQLTEDAQASFTSTFTPEPTQTFTPIPDTATPEPTPSPESEITSASVTPEFLLSGPAVKVTVDTNCRSGPGKSYTYLGALLVGEEAAIYGLDPSGTWYYINNPDQEEGFCWIWSFYAQTSGSLASLPLFTPGPTPTPEPNFSTAVHAVETCAGSWQVEFTIVNNGSVRLESVSSFVRDTVTGNQTATSSENYFQDKTGCAVTTNNEKREPGQTGFTVSLDLANDPTGHLTFGSITVCTEDFLQGDCRTREFYFTP